MLLVKKEGTMQDMLEKLAETIRHYEMEINVGLHKSKVIRISSREKPLWIIVGNQELKNFDQFRYLKVKWKKNAYCTKKIRSHIAIAKSGFTKKKSFLTSNMNLKLRKWQNVTYRALLFMDQNMDIKKNWKRNTYRTFKCVK